MQINTVSIIGLGALGILFGNHLSKVVPEGRLRIIADRDRISRYNKEGIYCNGELCRFNYMAPEDICKPADLLIFAVKYTGLEAAIKAAENQVGPYTIIISLLNGISSEELIGQYYGTDKVVYSFAQGMDAVKEGNRLTYHHMGMIRFGKTSQGGNDNSDKVTALENFFRQTAVPYEVVDDIRRSMWGKLMLNVGVNQAAAVYLCDYGGLQQKGGSRDIMIAAMREVIALSEKEGINLSEKDIEYWLSVLDGLNPQGKPSMQQDIEAGRLCEVELFAGTVLKLGEKHGLDFPVNRLLYSKLKDMESKF
jgi:2-dehydropantoate 2-reductase